MLIGVLIFTNIDCNVYADATSEGSYAEVVYVDGNAIKVTVDAENGIIKSQAVDRFDESSLTICENSDNIITVYDDEEEDFVDYEIEINDLSEENVDIEIINENDEIVDEFNDYDELIEDSYDGQASVAVLTTITVGSLITAILEASACIAVASVIYYGAKAAVKAIKKKKENKSYYYKAYIYEKNIFINLKKISRASAVSRIKKKKNVYTYKSSNAKNIVLATGLGCTSSEISDLRGKIRFYHYHTANRNGAHSFYGTPKIS